LRERLGDSFIYSRDCFASNACHYLTMKLDRHVASPPPKPLMIFDGDCNFCARWIRRWQRATGDGVEYLPFQDSRVAERFPELAREELATSVHLVEFNGDVFFGAEAALRALASNPRKQHWFQWYQRSSAFAKVAERAYRFVAGHRGFLSRFTR
jgi:predicted DCC family thiol-disulfide oxidoreductase YuxK